jgi:hypothetical protein
MNSMKNSVEKIIDTFVEEDASGSMTLQEVVQNLLEAFRRFSTDAQLFEWIQESFHKKGIQPAKKRKGKNLLFQVKLRYSLKESREVAPMASDWTNDPSILSLCPTTSTVIFRRKILNVEFYESAILFRGKKHLGLLSLEGGFFPPSEFSMKMSLPEDLLFAVHTQADVPSFRVDNVKWRPLDIQEVIYRIGRVIGVPINFKATRLNSDHLRNWILHGKLVWDIGLPGFIDHHDKAASIVPARGGGLDSKDLEKIQEDLERRQDQ